jgi:hypothetical protein
MKLSRSLSVALVLFAGCNSATKAEPYKIAKTPNPNIYDTAHPQIFDT